MMQSAVEYFNSSNRCTLSEELIALLNLVVDQEVSFAEANSDTIDWSLKFSNSKHGNDLATKFFSKVSEDTVQGKELLELSNSTYKVLDWNQYRIYLRNAKSTIGRGIVLGWKPEAIIKNIGFMIANNLPFAAVDTSIIPNYRDYRLKENIDDLVKRNILVRSLCGDTDHYHDCHVGAQFLKLDNEQKAWYALNFGFTYRAQWASLALQLFPYPHTETLEDISEWCGQIYHRDTNEFEKNPDGTTCNLQLIVVGKDCKWNKFKYPQFFKSVQDFSAGGNLYSKLEEAATRSDDPNVNYLNLNQVVNESFAGIGRFTSFLVMQQLYEFFDWPINGKKMGLEQEGTWSCRTGQIAVMSDLTKTTEAQIIEQGKRSPTKEFAEEMETHTENTINEANAELPFLTNVFEYESVTCEITDKYLLKQREFSFWTSAEKSEMITHVYENWDKNFIPTKAYPNKPDLSVLFLQQLSKRPGWMPYSWLDSNWMLTLNHLGISSFHNTMLTDEVDMCAYLPVKHQSEVVNTKFVNLVQSLYSENELEEIKVKYDPRYFIRWKKDIDLNGRLISKLQPSELEFIGKLPELEARGLLYHGRR